MTNINKTKIGKLYNLSPRTITGYFSKHLRELRALATVRTLKDGRVCVCQFYNPKQLQFIIDVIMKDTPEGYSFNGKTFVRIDDKEFKRVRE